MPYIRISLMNPQAGREAEVAELNEQLTMFYRQQEGCLLSYFVEAADGSGEMGRVSLWESEEVADRAANVEHSLALRSRLHLVVRAGHRDRSFLTK